MNREDIPRRAKKLEPWVNDFVYEGVRYAHGSGQDYVLIQDSDDRARAFFAAFPDARKILELGALEGADTVALARYPGTSILALEGRVENLRRAELVLEVHGADNAQLKVADVETVSFADLGHFDAVLCAGLMYHVQEPWILLEKIALVSDNLYLSTHYWGTREGLSSAAGYAVKAVREDHPEPRARGLSVDVRWLDRVSLFNALETAGFTDVEVLHERVSAQVCDIVAVCRRDVTRAASLRRLVEP